ncbi:unnamed protein product, partial [Meganyctiphanes norvegica]
GPKVWQQYIENTKNVKREENNIIKKMISKKPINVKKKIESDKNKPSKVVNKKNSDKKISPNSKNPIALKNKLESYKNKPLQFINQKYSGKKGFLNSNILKHKKKSESVKNKLPKLTKGKPQKKKKKIESDKNKVPKLTQGTPQKKKKSKCVQKKACKKAGGKCIKGNKFCESPIAGKCNGKCNTCCHKGCKSSKKCTKNGGFCSFNGCPTGLVASSGCKKGCSCCGGGGG